MGSAPYSGCPICGSRELLEELGALVELLGVARIRLLEARGVLLERISARATARTGAAGARTRTGPGPGRSAPRPRAGPAEETAQTAELRRQVGQRLGVLRRVDRLRLAHVR